MCAGATVYAALRHAGMTSRQRIGVVGVGAGSGLRSSDRAYREARAIRTASRGSQAGA